MLSKEFHYTVKFTPVDKDLFDKWSRSDDARYISRFARNVYERMEPGFDKSLTIDHINRDMFDNRRSNLRLATQEQQNLNRRMLRTNSSMHQGVSLRKKNGKVVGWLAKRRIKGKKGSKGSERKFDYTPEGLKAACLYYRQVLLADGSTCPTCENEEEDVWLSSVGEIVNMFDDFIIFQRA